MVRRYSLQQARAMLGVRGRRAVRRGFARAKKPSVVDLVSLSFGGINAVNKMGGIQKAMENPKGLLDYAKLYYTGQRGDGSFDFHAAWVAQWKPFAITQVAQALVMRTKVGKRIARWKVPFLNMSIVR